VVSAMRGAIRFFLLVVPTLALGAAAARAEMIAITGATVHPVSSPAIENATVLIADGRIVAVGADVAIPAGARLVDARGKVVTPGFLDSSAGVAAVEIGAYDDTTESRVEDDRVTAAFDVVDGLNPRATNVAVNRVEGIARAVVMPRPGESLIAGQAALVSLRPLAVPDPRAMVERAPVAMVAALGSQGADLAGGARAAALLRLREALEDARDFAANRRAYDGAERRDYALSRLDLEALAPVVRGELPLAVTVDRASDILAVLRFAGEQRLKLILVGGAEAWMVARELAEAGVPVILNPTSNLPDFESLGTTLENAARLARAGATVAFASFDAHNARDLRHAAGSAVAYGMPWDAALAAVTAVPARIWGIADRSGTLEPGKVADLVIWSGDPFELLTTAERVFLDGREVPADTRQRQLLERYRRLDDDLPPAYRP